MENTTVVVVESTGVKPEDKAQNGIQSPKGPTKEPMAETTSSSENSDISKALKEQMTLEDQQSPQGNNGLSDAPTIPAASSSCSSTAQNQVDDSNDCDKKTGDGEVKVQDGGALSIKMKGKQQPPEGYVMDEVETNLDLVQEKLYLGNLAAACDIPLLKKYRIKFILTIDSCPLPTKITDLPFVECKYLQLSDMPREDILRYFEETNQFIDNAVNSETNGNILVHCYYGVSRSATAVMAYLMQKYEISLEEAQDRLKSRRKVVGPNYGFLSQLKLYEIMGYRIDRSNLFYKRFRLHVASDKIKSVKVLPTPYTDVIKVDPALITARPEPVVYRCRKCRRILASASNLLHHTENKSPLWFDFKAKPGESQPQTAESNTSCSTSSGSGSIMGGGKSTSPACVLSSPLCNQMLFIEPLAWMTDVAQTLQGKLHCPNSNCKSKLGSYSWVMGCLCPCGAKVQPAFYLVPSKVDRSTFVLNVQITL